MSRLCIRETPVGPITLYEKNGAITQLDFAVSHSDPDPHPILLSAASQLSEYFSGRRAKFDLLLSPAGTGFQKRCWQVLQGIPYGTVITYGEEALRAGCPNGSRAAGQANHRNPIPILIPCHRVIAAGDKPGGYSSGLALKAALLHLEGIEINIDE